MRCMILPISGRVLVLNGLIIRSCLALLVVEQLAQYRHTHVTFSKHKFEHSYYLHIQCMIQPWAVATTIVQLWLYFEWHLLPYNQHCTFLPFLDICKIEPILRFDHGLSLVKYALTNKQLGSSLTLVGVGLQPVLHHFLSSHTLLRNHFWQQHLYPKVDCPYPREFLHWYYG